MPGCWSGVDSNPRCREKRLLKENLREYWRNFASISACILQRMSSPSIRYEFRVNLEFRCRENATAPRRDDPARARQPITDCFRSRLLVMGNPPRPRSRATQEITFHVDQVLRRHSRLESGARRAETFSVSVREKTGQGEFLSTNSVVEPSTISMILLWPYAPMNSRSAS